MARVAFFTETLPPDGDPISDFSFDLMRGLAEQQHELRILSTYRPGREVPPLPPRIEALFPFRRWSWLELPRVIPLLLQFQPDILHVIQPRFEAIAGWTNAMTAIASLPPLIGRPALVTSFYDLRKGDLGRHRSLLAQSQLVTVSTTPQYELMMDWADMLPNRPRVRLVPIPSATSREHRANLASESYLDEAMVASQREELPETLEYFLETHEKFVLVPGRISTHSRLDELFSLLAELLARTPEVGIVFGGEWGAVPAFSRAGLVRRFEDRGAGGRMIVAGQLNALAEAALFRRASAILVAALPPESLDLARFERMALRESAILVMSDEQAAIDSLSWRDRETAFVAGSEPHRWIAALVTALTDVELVRLLRQRLPEFARREAIDFPGNVMSRIYAELLGLRGKA